APPGSRASRRRSPAYARAPRRSAGTARNARTGTRRARAPADRSAPGRVATPALAASRARARRARRVAGRRSSERLGDDVEGEREDVALDRERRRDGDHPPALAPPHRDDAGAARAPARV